MENLPDLRILVQESRAKIKLLMIILCWLRLFLGSRIASIIINFTGGKKVIRTNL